MRTISRGMIIVAGVCALPFFASALSVEELGAQIQYLLQQIAILEAQLRASPSVPQTPYTDLPQSNSCPHLSRALGLGAQGDDVLQLQRFLVAQEVLGEDSVIGYFGPRTEAAVQHWQASQGIVFTGTPATTGFGVVGFRTRTAIAAVCNKAYAPVALPIQQCPLAPRPAITCLGSWSASTDVRGCTTSWRCSISAPDTTQCTAIALQCPAGMREQVGANCSRSCVPNTPQSGTLSASPASGQVPLTVTFSGTSLNVQYSLDFGDGAPIFSTSCSNGCGQLTNVQQTHTYTSTGTYIAKLTSYNQPAAPYYVTATVTITVGGTTPGSPLISVSESPSSAALGQTVSVSWNSQNTPSGSAVALYLVDISGKSSGVIDSARPTSGTMNWAIPSTNIGCADCPTLQSPPNPGTYVIVTNVYTPSNAWISGYPPANPTYPTFWATASSSPFTITQ